MKLWFFAYLKKIIECEKRWICIKCARDRKNITWRWWFIIGLWPMRLTFNEIFIKLTFPEILLIFANFFCLPDNELWKITFYVQLSVTGCWRRDSFECFYLPQSHALNELLKTHFNFDTQQRKNSAGCCSEWKLERLFTVNLTIFKASVSR
jgi:hypothetical protein